MTEAADFTSLSPIDIWLFNLLTLSVPEEVYSRTDSSALNYSKYHVFKTITQSIHCFLVHQK
jgi:hypothetical protein